MIFFFGRDLKIVFVNYIALIIIYYIKKFLPLHQLGFHIGRLANAQFLS